MPAAARHPFTEATFEFLRDLEHNNTRDWFGANKWRYEQHLLDPALEFIAAMQEPLAQFAPHLTAIPKRTGGSLMRVYRDTRFSRDKTPYKTNIGIQFRHELGKDVHAPGFYVHIDPQQVFVGAGMWHPPSAALAAIRQRIDERPEEWRQARDERTFRRHYQLAGQSLARAPRGYAAGHALIEDLRRKDFIGVKNLDHDAVLKAGFVRRIATAFKAAAPFMQFLCRAVNVPY